MSVYRKTALSTVERQSWEGNYFDSLTHARMFRSYTPHQFGVKSAELFSSKLGSQFINKKFTYYTVAKNNVYYTPGGVDDYSWQLVSPYARTFRITELITTDANPGKGGQKFKIAIDTNALQEPVLIKLEDPNLPLLRIVGQPESRGIKSWAYTLELQTSDLTASIPLTFLQPGREVVDVSTMVSDELNQKFGGDQFSEMFKLQSFVGNFARKAEFTDKFIRTEIAHRKAGKSMPASAKYSIGGESYSDGAIGVGYVYQQDFTNNTGKVINKGVFISNLEARLEERIHRDREMNFEFGQLQKTKDYDSGRTIKVAPGWRQIRRDGHYLEHNGSLSLSDFEDYITNIFATRREFSDRRIKMAAGEGGLKFMHRLIAAEASQFQLIDSVYVQKRDTNDFNENELEFGAQFTKVRLLNGIILEMVYDPIKDDPTLFPIKAPGSMHSVESFTFDFFDMGSTDQKAMDAAPENMTCVMQEGVEGYWHSSQVYNFETGVITDGSNAYGNSKELGVYRETSGSLCVWDTSRIGAIVYVPVTV